MAVTDYKSPGTAANVDRDGEVAWSDPDNSKNSNDAWSIADVDKDDYSDWLRVTNFSMGVPAGATIDGIEVQIEKHVEIAEEGVDSAVYLRKTTVGQVGDNYAEEGNWNPTTDATSTYGGAADLWNTSWSATDVNHSDFGLDLSGLADGGAAAFSVDHIQIRIHYTAVGVEPTTSINIGGTWKSISALKINIDDAWKAVASAKINIGDDWKALDIT